MPDSVSRLSRLLGFLDFPTEITPADAERHWQYLCVALHDFEDEVGRRAARVADEKGDTPFEKRWSMTWWFIYILKQAIDSVGISIWDGDLTVPTVNESDTPAFITEFGREKGLLWFNARTEIDHEFGRKFMDPPDERDYLSIAKIVIPMPTMTGVAGSRIAWLFSEYIAIPTETPIDIESLLPIFMITGAQLDTFQVGRFGSEFAGIFDRLDYYYSTISKERPLRRAFEGDGRNRRKRPISKLKTELYRKITYFGGTQGQSRTFHLTNRHAVNGHWRHQWYPSRDSHDWKWINSYLKGPEGSDILPSPVRVIRVRR